MVQLEELDADAPPPEEVPGASLSSRVCDGLWLASELALEEDGGGGACLVDRGVTHVVAFGSAPPGASTGAFAGVHAYERAENGALVTHMREAIGFVDAAISGGGQVAFYSEEEGEAGAAFLLASYLVLARANSPEDATEAVMRARALCGLKTHEEFPKNLRFLGRNGIPDWA